MSPRICPKNQRFATILPEPRTQDASTQGDRRAMDNDASHSTQHSSLIYLLQEVSKLASPLRSRVLDTEPTSTRLNETPRPIVPKQEEDVRSFQTSHSSFGHGGPRMAPQNEVKSIKEDSQVSKVATLIEPHPECRSPWKVLSLINLQCEKLLHHGDVEESHPTSVSSAPALRHSVDESSTAAADLEDRGGDLMHVTYSYTPSVVTYMREEIPACESPLRDLRACGGGAGGYKSDCCAKNSQLSCCAQSQTAERLEVSAAASSRPHRRDQMEDRFSVDGQFEWNREYKMDCSSSELDILNVPFSESALSQTMPVASQLIFDSDVALSKPALILDHNANLALTTEAPCDTQLCHRSSVLPSSLEASLLLSITEEGYRLPNQHDKINASKHGCTQKSPPVSHLKSSSSNDESNPLPSATSMPEPRPVQKEEIAPPSPQRWTSKARRKQPHPSRSVDIQEPDFQGVMFRMDTELDDSREQCRLLITSKYSKELCKSARKPRMRTRTAQKSLKISSSDEESDLTTGVSKGKICASCCTRKTPMWRDAEDGTPLCNACGIRYKKYRVRCINCWHIPRKEGNSNSCCLKCGNFVKLSSAARKHTT